MRYPYYDQECISLYYMPGQNIFVNSEGHTVTDIYYYVDPNDLLIFKYHQETMVIKNGLDVLVELVYPDELEDD